MQCNNTQHNTIQCNAVQYNTIQYNATIVYTIQVYLINYSITIFVTIIINAFDIGPRS